jgi:hypothetical protein
LIYYGGNFIYLLEAQVMNSNKPQLNEEAIAEMRWGAERPQRFLCAWKKGVKLIGQQYFSFSGDIDQANDIKDLKPNKELIDASLPSMSTSEAIFLASMYSFYNGEDGQLYLSQLQYPSLSDIASKLDKRQLEIIAELFINYHGW